MCVFITAGSRIIFLDDRSVITYAGPDADCVLPGSPQFCEGKSDDGSSTATDMKMAPRVLHTDVVAVRTWTRSVVGSGNLFGMSQGLVIPGDSGVVVTLPEELGEVKL